MVVTARVRQEMRQGRTRLFWRMQGMTEDQYCEEQEERDLLRVAEGKKKGSVTEILAGM